MKWSLASHLLNVEASLKGCLWMAEDGEFLKEGEYMKVADCLPCCISAVLRAASKHVTEDALLS